MEKIAQPEQFYHLLAMTRTNFMERAKDLVEEHILCTLKIKQLKQKRINDPEQEALLENIRKEDEKRLLEMLRST